MVIKENISSEFSPSWSWLRLWGDFVRSEAKTRKWEQNSEGQIGERLNKRCEQREHGKEIEFMKAERINCKQKKGEFDPLETEISKQYLPACVSNDIKIYKLFYSILRPCKAISFLIMLLTFGDSEVA